MKMKLKADWEEILPTIETTACGRAEINDWLDRQQMGVNTTFTGKYDEDGDLELDNDTLFLPPELIEEA